MGNCCLLSPISPSSASDTGFSVNHVCCFLLCLLISSLSSISLSSASSKSATAVCFLRSHLHLAPAPISRSIDAEHFPDFAAIAWDRFWCPMGCFWLCICGGYFFIWVYFLCFVGDIVSQDLRFVYWPYPWPISSSFLHK